MADLKLKRDHPKINFGQIMGICDHVTLALGNGGYNVRKLILYGDFEELFPWLLRRLDENRDILGAAQQDRCLLNKELFSRHGDTAKNFGIGLMATTLLTSWLGIS